LGGAAVSVVLGILLLRKYIDYFVDYYIVYLNYFELLELHLGICGCGPPETQKTLSRDT